MKKEIERRSLPVQLRVDQENGKRTIVGYASVFNVLSRDLGGYKEIILPKAFDEVIKTTDCRALVDHVPFMILGRTTAGTLRLATDEHGLSVEIDVPDTSYARDLLVSLERGDITQMSFGFVPGPYVFYEDSDLNTTVAELDRVIELLDVSCVTYPAYDETECSIRSFNSYRETRTKKPDHRLANRKKYIQTI